MPKKLSELDSNERIYFENIMNFMNETWNDDIKQRLKIARKFDLDVYDEYIMELLTPKNTHPSLQIENPVASLPENRVTKIYGEKWIVIQNRLLHAISDLDLNERRLIMYLSPIVRKAVDIDPTQRVFTVKVKEFQAGYDIKGNYLYEELAEIADSIIQKAFFFWYGGKKGKSKKGVSWVSECDYLESEGALQIKLDDTVIEMLTIFDKNNPFTKYQREMIVNLGVHGIILFELIASCMHQKYKQKSYEVEYLREKFNCLDSYLKLADFKRYVLDNAIKDIEKHTPYRIQYTQKKKGRIVSDIVFSFEDTSEQALENERKSLEIKTSNESKKTQSWQMKGLTDAQINKLKAFKKEFCDSNTSKMSSTFSGSYDELIEIWRPMLKDPSKVTSFNKIQELLDRQI